MALNIDKKLQQEGISPTPESTAQQTAETKPAAQPIDFSAQGEQQSVKTPAKNQPIDMTSKGQSSKSALKVENEIYEVKKGDSLWKVAKQMLIDAGNPNPTSAQITLAMNKIVAANGCKTIEECKNKFFNLIGSELNVTGLFVEHQETKPVEVPVEATQPTVSEQPDETTKTPDAGQPVEAIQPVETEQLQPAETPSTADVEQPIETAQTPETEQSSETAQTTDASTVQKSELEILADEIGMDGDIDDIIANLNKKRAKGDALSESEQKILKIYNDKIEQVENVGNKTKLIDLKELASSDFKKKSLNERIEIITERYLIENDSYYNGLKTKRQKSRYLREKVDDVKNMVMQKRLFNGARKMREDGTVLKVVTLLQMAQYEGKSIEQMKRMDFNERDEKLKSAFNSAVKSMLKKAYDTAGISKEEFDSLSPEQKMNIYLDAYLSITDDRYAEKTEQQKEKLRQEKFVEMISNNTGIDISKADKSEIKNLYAITSSKIDYILSKSGSDDVDIFKELKDFDNQPFSKKSAVMYRYLSKKSVLTADEKKYMDLCKEYINIKDWMLSNNYNEADLDDPKKIFDAMRQMEKDGKHISKETRKEVISLVKGGKLGVEMKLGEGLENVALNRGIKKEKLIKQSLKGINKRNYNTAESLKKIDELLRMARGRTDDYAAIIKIAKDMGIPKEFIEQRINANEELRRMRIARAEDGKETAQLIESALKSGDSAAMADAKRISGIIQEKDYFEDRQDIIDADKILVEHEELREPVAKAIRANYTVEEGSGIVSEILNSTDVSDASAAKFSYTFMDVGDAAENVEYMKHFANTVTRAPAMEGFAAASNTIEDPGLRSQYNAAVESGLANYTPEQQATIRTAMQTGSISQETLSKTSSSSSSSSSQQSSSQQSSQQVSAQGTRSGQQSAQASAQNSASQQTAQQSAAPERLPQIQALQQQNAQYIEQQRVARLQAADQQRVVEQQQTTEAQKQVEESRKAEEKQKIEEQIRQGVEADEAFRQEVMAKAKELAEDIQESVAEWENRHRKLTTEEGELITAGIAIDAAVEAINSSGISSDDKNALIAQISKASSIDEIYEILISRSVNIGSVKEKVLDLLGSSASPESVRNVVAELISDDTVVKELFKRTSSTSIKKELLSMMSTDTVVELLASKQIKNIGDVDHKILRTFLEKNIYSMSNADFNEYLKHLPLDDRMALVELRNNARGNKNQTVPSGENHDADMVTLAQFNQSMPESNVVTSTTPETPENPRFAVGEITKRVGNEFVTQVGTTTVTENVYEFGAEDSEIGTAEWKKFHGLEDHGLLAFIDNENDESDPNNPNFAQMGDGNRRIPNRGRRSRRNKGINFFS